MKLSNANSGKSFVFALILFVIMLGMPTPEWKFVFGVGVALNLLIGSVLSYQENKSKGGSNQ